LFPNKEDAVETPEHPVHMVNAPRVNIAVKISFERIVGIPILGEFTVRGAAALENIRSPLISQRRRIGAGCSSDVRDRGRCRTDNGGRSAASTTKRSEIVRLDRRELDFRIWQCALPLHLCQQHGLELGDRVVEAEPVGPATNGFLTRTRLNRFQEVVNAWLKFDPRRAVTWTI